MGMLFAHVAFNERAPSLSEICDKIEEITSLSVVVLEQNSNELHELNARIAFKCAPENEIELLAYRPGAPGRFCDETFVEPSHSLVMKSIVQGANEPSGTQTVYLRGYMGQEETLMHVAKLALATLGGMPRIKISDDARRIYGRRITADELDARYREMVRQNQWATWFTIVMLPLLIPFWIIGCLWGLMTIPYRIYRAIRILKQLESHK